MKKNIIYILLAVMPVCLFSQAQFEIVTVNDTTFQLKSTTVNDDNSETISLSSEMDSTQLINHIIRLAYNTNTKAARQYLKNQIAAKEANRLESLLPSFIDTSYNDYTQAVLLPRVTGEYVLRENGNRTTLKINKKGRVIEEEQQLPNVARKGRIVVKSNLEIEIRNFFLNENITFYQVSRGLWTGYDNNNNKKVLRKR